MSIQISSDLQTFVEEAVDAGRYGSPSEVVSAALMLLKEKESRRESWEKLKREVAIGIEASRRGESTDSEEFFRELEAEHPGLFDEEKESCP